MDLGEVMLPQICKNTHLHRMWPIWCLYNAFSLTVVTAHSTSPGMNSDQRTWLILKSGSGQRERNTQDYRAVPPLPLESNVGSASTGVNKCFCPTSDFCSVFFPLKKKQNKHTRRILEKRPPLSSLYIIFPRSSAVSSQPACLQQLRLNMSHWFSLSDCFGFLHTESNADSRIMLPKLSAAVGPFLIGSSLHSPVHQKQCYGSRNTCAFVDSVNNLESEDHWVVPKAMLVIVYMYIYCIYM